MQYSIRPLKFYKIRKTRHQKRRVFILAHENDIHPDQGVIYT